MTSNQEPRVSINATMSPSETVAMVKVLRYELRVKDASEYLEVL